MWAEFTRQARLRDIAGLLPDHRNKPSIAAKRVVILLLVEGLAFLLKKKDAMYVSATDDVCLHAVSLATVGVPFGRKLS